MKETKFKDTEIGRIPEEWEIYPLSSIVSDMADGPFGSNLKTEHYISEKQVRVVQLSNIGDDGWHNSNTKYTSFTHASTLSRCIIPTGSVLIAKMMPAGRAIICPNIDSQYILGSDVVRITCNTKVEPKYFVYYTKSKLYLEQISDYTQGSTRQRTSISKLKTMQIVIPPAKEQYSIASALTSINNLISSLGKLIEKKKNIKQGAMQQLLTGQIRLKGFSEPWVKRKLGDIGSLAMCKRIFQEETSEKGDVPFYKIGTFGQQADAYITKGKYEQFKQMYRFPQKGDVLISAAGTIGRTVIYNGEPAYFQDSNIVWLAHNGKYITNNFLFYIYQRTDWNTEDTTIARLYNNNFNNTCIHFPSSITEQQAIANILSKMDNEITALETKKAKYEAIKQGMMQQLLTGKIRLIS